MSDKDRDQGMSALHDVVVIGGSLAGLTFALACAHRGIRTRLLERRHGQHQSGGALGLDRSLLLRVIGVNSGAGSAVEPFPVLTDYRRAVSWQALHTWLRNLARKRPEITLMDGISISEVVQSDFLATAITSDGERINAPIVVGADGYRSVVRKAVDPQKPFAAYAGYLLWRGLVPETDLPAGTDRPQSNNGVVLITKTGYRLIAYPVAGSGGSLRPGERLLSFAWYDGGRAGLLREANCLSPTGSVLSSLAPENIPEDVSEELRDLARRIWPEPWCAAITHALDRRGVFATPGAEYFPERVHRGPLAIIGDAAHVVSPATGMGFVAGIRDAEALADALACNLDRTAARFPRALEGYGQRRLRAAQQLVTRSIKWSRDYLRQMKSASPDPTSQHFEK